jgi:hypothetical protein
MNRIRVAAALAACVCLGAPMALAQASPAIEIMRAPACGGSGAVSGTVIAAEDVTQFSVFVYAKQNNRWVVQPNPEQARVAITTSETWAGPAAAASDYLAILTTAAHTPASQLPAVPRVVRPIFGVQDVPCGWKPSREQ